MKIKVLENHAGDTESWKASPISIATKKKEHEPFYQSEYGRKKAYAPEKTVAERLQII